MMKGQAYKPGDEKGGRKEPEYRKSNNWYFANTKDICRQVWNIGKEYGDKMKGEKKPTRHNRFPVQLIKYFYFLYLTGSRLCEPLQQPGVEFDIVNDNSGTYISLSKVNEKHHKADGTREVMQIIIPIFDEAEKDMWEYITNGGTTTRTEDIFEFEKWGTIRKDKVSKLIKTNFKTNLKDQEGKLHKDSGITPHILRHMRAYNILINHKVPPSTAIKFFGWSNERMLYYYSHIQRILSAENQLSVYKSHGLLTNLKINSGFIVTSPI